MWYYLVKIVVTTVLIIAVSEVAKRYTFAGALLASLPIISIVAMIWLHLDGKEPAHIAKLSTGIFWLVLPSLVLFLVLPYLLVSRDVAFPLAMSLACGATIVTYAAMVFVLARVGVKL